MKLFEEIASEGQVLAYIIRASIRSERTTFLTPPEFKQQVGFVVYPQGGEIHRHVHRPLKRHLEGTSEVLFVRSGRCEVDLYNTRHDFVATRELGAGDVVLLVDGGHGFRILEDTVFLEIKQGPYSGVEEEKEHF
jgi:quercetin dioxygenase-like cupin family protein